MPYLFENKVLAPPRSCDGEPAPERVLPAILPAGIKPPEFPKGDLKFGSVGELFADDAPERGCRTTGGGRNPSVGSSVLADVIIKVECDPRCVNLKCSSQWRLRVQPELDHNHNCPICNTNLYAFNARKTEDAAVR